MYPHSPRTSSRRRIPVPRTLFGDVCAGLRPRRLPDRQVSGTATNSNATAVQSMSKLVTLSREFEMITKVIEAFSQVDKKAATDIASSR